MCICIHSHHSEHLLSWTQYSNNTFIFTKVETLALANKTSPCELSHMVLVCLACFESMRQTSLVARKKVHCGNVFLSYYRQALLSCHCFQVGILNRKQETRYCMMLLKSGVHLQQKRQAAACSPPSLSCLTQDVSTLYTLQLSF